MKKLIFIFALVLVLAISGCGKSADAVSSSDTTASSESSPSISSISSESSESESMVNVGGEDYCYAHKMTYHSFDRYMVALVGRDNFDEWIESCTGPCSSNLVAFVEHFGVTKEQLMQTQESVRANIDDDFWDVIYNDLGMTQDEYMGSMALSDEQIDAIYSGDEAKIETAFAGYLAADAEDGSRYSLTWLESHTPEEYAAVGIEPQSVEEMVSKIETDDEYKKYRAEVSAVSEQMAEAEAMMAE